VVILVVFNFRFLREDVKYAKNVVHELLFHAQIVTQVIYFYKQTNKQKKKEEEEAENSYSMGI
jgi:ureidoglycolate hydrolase